MPDSGHNKLDELIVQGRLFAEVQETAQILKCDPRTIRTACRLGEIPYTKVGTHYRIPVAWLRIAAGQGATR
jgi:excisionase family DNA binding protein